MPENEEVAPATEAQQNVAQASDANVEAASTAKDSDELSEDDLEAVAGGVETISTSKPHYSVNPTDKPVTIGPSYYDKPPRA